MTMEELKMRVAALYRSRKTIERRRLLHAGAAALLAIPLLLNGCASSPSHSTFYHRVYRERYAITVDELKTLQFYISRKVLAHAIDGSPGVAPEQVVIVDAGTPGLVRDAGPDWMRVAFTEGGEGVLFRTQIDRQDSVYVLANATESGQIVPVTKLPEPIVTLGGRRYKIIQGADAYLIVSSENLDKLIESRPHAAGVEHK